MRLSDRVLTRLWWISLVGAVLGWTLYLWSAERRLDEIRDVLIEIRDQGRQR